MKHVLLVLWIAAILSGCSSVESVNRLDGIVVVSKVQNGAKLNVNRGLHVWQPKTSSNEVTLAPGEKLSFGDGFHFTTTLQFVGINQGRLEFRTETESRPPNEPKKREVRRLAVLPYGTDLQ
jgi:hypothetical protein